MAFVFGGLFLAILFGFAAVAQIVPPVLCPIVFAATFLMVIAFLLMAFVWNGALRGKSIVDAMRIFAKTVPYFLGRKPPEGPADPL
jgi:hypothetical protein